MDHGDGGQGDAMDHASSLTLGDDGPMLRVVLGIYGVFAALLPLLLLVVFGVRQCAVTPVLWLCVAVAWALLGVNMGMAPHQVENFYEHELAYTNSVAQNAFYAGAFLFALGSFSNVISQEKVRGVFPILLLAVLFIAGAVLPAVTVHTRDTRAILVLKSVRTAAFSCAMGLIVCTAALLLHQTKDNLAQLVPPQ